MPVGYHTDSFHFGDDCVVVGSRADPTDNPDVHKITLGIAVVVDNETTKVYASGPCQYLDDFMALLDNAAEQIKAKDSRIRGLFAPTLEQHREDMIEVMHQSAHHLDLQTVVVPASLR